MLPRPLNQIIQINQSLSLEPIDLSHSAELFFLVEKNRASLRKWLTWVDYVKAQDNQDGYIKYYQKKKRLSLAAAFVILYCGKIAGLISFNEFSATHQSTSLGYWLGQEFRKKGLMHMTCRALLDIAFSDLQLRRVHINCASNNFESQKIPLGLGFKQEGLLVQAEKLHELYIDLKHYSLLAKEHQERNYLL